MSCTAAKPAGPSRIGWALATLAAWTVITFGGALLLRPAERGLDEIVTQGVLWQVVLAAAMLFVVSIWRGWSDLGLNAPERGTLRLLWFPLLLVALQMLLALLLGLPSVGVGALILLNTACVGVSEEVMFRGVLYRAFRQRMKIWPAILLTSVLFGAVHVLNGVITGAFADALRQALVASCSGLLLMAIFLRTGSLWTAIVWHALWDAATFLVALGGTGAATPVAAEIAEPNGLAQTLIPLALVLPGLLYALWLLRHVHRAPPAGDRQAAGMATQ